MRAKEKAAQKAAEDLHIKAKALHVAEEEASSIKAQKANLELKVQEFQ